MTDTPTPKMTPEQRAVLVAELRLPWFTNGCEWYQVRAANSLEADGVTIATLTAERDAAIGSEKTARNLMQKAFDVNRKVIAERDAAQAEIARLTAALATVFEIASTRHIPDQPAAYAGTELDWATRQYGSLRRDILDAIQKGAAT